jgi:hypothetical protein
MTQTFQDISVDVKLNRNEFETFKVYEGEELWCFDWDDECCYDYGEDDNDYDDDDEEYDGVHYFTISKDAKTRFGKYCDGNIRTVAEARMVIDQFNKDFGLDWGLDRFVLRCTSKINL